MSKGVCWIRLPGVMLHKKLEEKNRSFDDMPWRNAANFLSSPIVPQYGCCRNFGSVGPDRQRWCRVVLACIG